MVSACVLSTRRVTRGRYRQAYERAVGPIPLGCELHHTCGNAACMNLTHLTPVSRVEHMRLDGRINGAAAAAVKRAITHCARGHEFTPENTGYQERADGRVQRYCRTCRRAYARRNRKGKAMAS